MHIMHQTSTQFDFSNGTFQAEQVLCYATLVPNESKYAKTPKNCAPAQFFGAQGTFLRQIGAQFDLSYSIFNSLQLLCYACMA